MSATAAVGGSKPRPSFPSWLALRSLAATIGLAMLTIVGGVFFRPVFEAWSFLIPPLVGAIAIACLVSVICDHFKTSNGEAALAHLVLSTLFLPGLMSLSEAKFGLPFPRSIGQLFRALIDGPALLLTTPTPARSGQELLVAPVTSAWVGFAVGWVLLRSGRATWSLAGPTLVVICALAFGPTNSSFLGLVSAVFLLGTLLHIVYVSRDRESNNRRVEWVDDRKRPLRPIAILSVGVVVTIASGLARFAPTIGKDNRFTLRTYRTPPFDPTDLPSPLAGYAKYLHADESKLLFTAKGEDLPERWRLATLTTYDGRVWSVGKSSEGGGTFALLGARLSDPKLLRKGWKKASTTITIDSLNEPFLPIPGPALTMSFPNDMSASELDRFRNGVRYNEYSDTLISASRSEKGRSYGLTWASYPTVDLSKLSGLNFGEALQEQLPPSKSAKLFGAKANAWAGDAEGWDAVSRLKSALDSGFYSPNAPPGHAYGELAKLLANENSLAGNGEHYAALLGVLTRTKGIASRVVVGFKPQRQGRIQKIFGRDIRAWVEVNVADVGWVPVDLEQDINKKPLPKKTKPKASADEAPPPPNTIPSPEPETLEVEPSKKKDQVSKQAGGRSGVPVAVLVGTGVAGTPIAFGAFFVGVVAMAKRRRRARRRRAEPKLAVAGAWEELLERASEAGESSAPNRTITEYAATLFPEDEEKRRIVSEVAVVSERAAFHADAPTSEASTQAWKKVEELRALLSQSASPWTRFKRLADPRSLVRGSVRDAFSRS